MTIAEGELPSLDISETDLVDFAVPRSAARLATRRENIAAKNN